jgi:hypothetical protein
MLEPDRDQIEQFVNAIFRHAGSQGFVAVRSFLEGNDKPFRLSGTALTGGLRFLIDVAEVDARRAAQHPQPVVFCPPLAIFSNKDRSESRTSPKAWRCPSSAMNTHKRRGKHWRRYSDQPRSW